MSSAEEPLFQATEPDRATSRWLHGRLVAHADGAFDLRLDAPSRWTRVPAGVGALLLCVALVVSSAGWAMFWAWLACLFLVPVAVTLFRYVISGPVGPLAITDHSVKVPSGPFSTRTLLWSDVDAIEADGRQLRFVLDDGSRLRVRNSSAPEGVTEGVVAVLDRVRVSRRCAFLTGLTRRKGLQRWSTPTHSGVELDLSPVFKPVPNWLPIVGGLMCGATLFAFGGATVVMATLVLLVVLPMIAWFHPDGASRGARSVQLSIDTVRLQVEIGLPFGRSRRWTVPVSSITDVRGAGYAVVVDTTEGSRRIPLRGRSLATVWDTAARIREALSSSVQAPAGRDAVPEGLARLAAGSRERAGDHWEGGS